MSDNLNNILGIGVDTKSDKISNNPTIYESKAERTLQKVASVQLWIGLVVAFICFVVVFTDEGQRNEAVGIPCLIGSIVITLSSITIWALLKVIANISLTLKGIQDKVNHN